LLYGSINIEYTVKYFVLICVLYLISREFFKLSTSKPEDDFIRFEFSDGNKSSMEKDEKETVAHNTIKSTISSEPNHSG